MTGDSEAIIIQLEKKNGIQALNGYISQNKNLKDHLTKKIMQVKVVWSVDIKVIKHHHNRKKRIIITIALKNMLVIKFGMKQKEIQHLSYTELHIIQNLELKVKQLNSSRLHHQVNSMD